MLTFLSEVEQKVSAESTDGDKRAGVMFPGAEQGIPGPPAALASVVRGRGLKVRAASSLCAFLPAGSGVQVNMS